MPVLYSNSRIFVIPVYIFNGRKQTLVDTIGILSALHGLHDKRHLLAKLCIAGSENCQTQRQWLKWYDYWDVDPVPDDGFYLFTIQLRAEWANYSEEDNPGGGGGGGGAPFTPPMGGGGGGEGGVHHSHHQWGEGSASVRTRKGKIGGLRNSLKPLNLSKLWERKWAAVSREKGGLHLRHTPVLIPIYVSAPPPPQDISTPCIIKIPDFSPLLTKSID